MNTRFRFTERNPYLGGLPYTRTERAILWLLIGATVAGAIGVGWLIVSLAQWLLGH